MTRKSSIDKKDKLKSLYNSQHLESEYKQIIPHRPPRPKKPTGRIFVNKQKFN